MKCPSCGCEELKTLDSRPSKHYRNAIRRRRECQRCSLRFATMEIIVEGMRKNQDIYEKVRNANTINIRVKVRCVDCNHLLKRRKQEGSAFPYGRCIKCGGYMKRNKHGRPKKEATA